MNRYIRRVLVAIIVVVLLVSCQQPTPEEPLSNDDGIEALLLGESPHYAPWYLSYDFRYDPALPDVPIELQNCKIVFPTSYSLEQDGVEITVDFFQESYHLGELIQVRITLENHTETMLSYDPTVYHPLEHGTILGMGLGMGGEFVSENDQYLECAIAYSRGYIDYPNLGPADDEKTIFCEAGETHVLEYVYIADPAFFCPDGQEQQFWFCAGIADEGMLPIEIRIPVQVIIQ